MKTIFLILILPTCFCWEGGLPVYKLFPLGKDMPEEEYKNHITVHLVKKTWKPNLPGMGKFQGPLASYPYDRNAALKVFYNNENYESCSKKLAAAATLITDQYCGYKLDLESVMFVTTLSGNAYDTIAKNIIFGMAMRNMLSMYNVFVFDMSEMERSMALTASRQVFGWKGNYEGVSRSFADFIMSAGIKAEGINLVGFCYSAQLIIHVAREIKVQSKQKIKSILSLDPNSSKRAKKLYKGPSTEDAQFFHSYHTNSLKFGTTLRGGAVDIVFNDGIFQPGSESKTNRNVFSHRRAVIFLWWIIIYPDLFVARRCNDWVTFKNCLCKTEELFQLTFPPSGKTTGQFHLKTSDKSPYGLGIKGSGVDCEEDNE